MKRRLLIFLIFILLASIVLWIYRGDYWNNLSDLYTDEQVAFNIPTYREISNDQSLNSDLFITEIDNLRFEHQYEKPIIKEDIELNNGTYVEFDQNKKMVVVSVKKGDLSGWGKLNDEQQRLLSKIYGPSLIKDDYSLLLKALKLTPQDFSWFSLQSNEKLQAKLLLYEIKLSMTNNSLNVFSFQTKKIKGFQRGKKGDRKILLQIFDGENKQDESYEILLIGNFAQEEIDAMLQSMEFLND